MTEKLDIRSVKQYFNEFIVEGLKGKTKVSEVDLVPIKQQILDHFRKEIFGQIIFKLGPEAKNMSRDEMAKLEFVNNILKQSVRKWRRLCILCSEYGLGQFFQLDDLRQVLEEAEPDPEETIVIPDGEEDVTDKLDEILPDGETPVYLNGGVKIEDSPAQPVS